MSRLSVTLLGLFAYVLVCSGEVKFNNGGYDGIVVSIAESVPVTNCRSILQNLEQTLSNTSQSLYAALNGRAYFSSITVLLPDSWPSNCTVRPVTGYDGLEADILVAGNHPVYGDKPWTQQAGGCGDPGDFIAVSYKLINGAKTLSSLLVTEWSKYRYGVIDETGYHGDVIYPVCYQGEEGDHVVTGCSDRPIQDMGVCNGENAAYNNSQLVSADAATSLMFAPTAPQVGRFCDEATHDRYAPTKHNFMCRHKSVSDIIDQHPDFNDKSSDQANTVDTKPTISYKRRSSTRFVLIIEENQAMMLRESWAYLRAAVRKFAVLDLPAYTELGLVLANETTSNIVQNLTVLKTSADRDRVASTIPYTPGDTHHPACLHCAVSQALQMLEERAQSNGPATSVIVVIAPGFTPSASMDTAASRAVARGVRIATVNYPDVSRTTPLDILATRTGGRGYTVREQRYNMATSYLTTYFQLANTLFDVAGRFSAAAQASLPIEIHRREFWDEGRSSITGSFVLEESLSEPARFTVFTHNTENPLIRGMSLVSPSQVVYATRSDSLLSMKLLTLMASINETGTWTYTIERFPGNPQPHFVQVLASPRSRYAGVVTADAVVSGNVVRVRVTRGQHPVLGARVEVTAVRMGVNASTSKEKFELVDTGSGDPDTTKGDGVYSRRFTPHLGAGTYMLNIVVTDNSNTAYSYQDQVLTLGDAHPGTCCGSTVPVPQVRPISPFTRIITPLTAFIPVGEPIGRIGNLRADILPEQLKSRLVFTAPDPQAKRYAVRYSRTVRGLVDNLAGSSTWEYGSPFPLAPGSDSSFTLDYTRNPSLLDKPHYFCIQSFATEQDPGTEDAPTSDDSCSNWVRVMVPSPPPPPPTDYPSSADDHLTSAIIPSIASAADFNLQLILPVAGGVLLLALCIAIYCYICVHRRRGEKKKKEKKAQTSIQIVPSSPAVAPQFDPTLDEKKRASVAPQYEEKLVDDPIATITPVRQRTLSPYQSWTASQLLHEHERRHSPYGEVSHNPNITYDGGNPNLTFDSNYDGNYEQHSQYNAPASVYGDNQSIQHYYLEQTLRNQYNEANNPPPVPPLPSLNGIYASGPIYGVQPGTFAANGYHRNGSLMQFNPSVQGSLSSVSSGDKKKRNVTMV